jgi:uncharacterized protein (UPF0332 family)
MTPRPEAFLVQARDRVEDATRILPLVHPAVVVTTAYHAMLNAARAALADRDIYPKTDRGVWSHLDSDLVAAGEFDRDLSDLAMRAWSAFERVDREADPADPAEAAELVAGAAEFVAAVERMLVDRA